MYNFFIWHKFELPMHRQWGAWVSDGDKIFHLNIKDLRKYVQWIWYYLFIIICS